MQTRDRETWNMNLMDGGQMDKAQLEKLARLKADRDEIMDEIQRLLVARAETQNAVIDKMLLSRIDRKWAELDHVNQNIRNVELGREEIEWVATDLFDDLQPEDGAPLWH